MIDSLPLVRPLVLSFYHRLRPGRGRGGRRLELSMVAGVIAYAILFAAMTKIVSGSLLTVAGLSSLRGFASAAQAGLELRVASLVVALALGFLFVINVHGSAARSLDPRGEGGDLLLLLSQPVDLGRVLVARAIAASLLDPLGFLLGGPLLTAFISVELRAGPIPSAILALPVYVGLRSAVQAAALLLVLLNRAWLPSRIRAEPAATAEAILFLATMLRATGIDPVETVQSFRSAPTLVTPLAELTARAALLVPAPLALLLEGMVSGKPWPLFAGWAALLGFLAFCQLVARRLPAHLLAAQSRRTAGARALGRVWDALWPHCERPAALVLLKDVVTAWRSNLMMAPALGVVVPVGLYVVHRSSKLLERLPLGAVMTPVLLLASTAITATLCELAEGAEPPPLPISRGRMAALKATSSVALTILFSALVLVAGFSVERWLPALPWVATAGALLSVLLSELLAFAPGAASEVFTPGGSRTAALWSICAIGLGGLAGETELAGKLPLLVLGLGTVAALWGRERMLEHDMSIRDMVVLVGLFLFASRAMGILAGFAAAIGGGLWTGLLCTAALELGLGWMTVEYLRQSLGTQEVTQSDALGLPAEQPIQRAAFAAACGGGLALLFGLLGGFKTAGGAVAGIGLAGLAQMLVASALGPLVEECFFRATVHRSMSRALGRMPGILVSSVIFAAAHAGPPSVTLFVLGAVLAGLYDLRQSVFEPAVAHMAFNHAQIVLAALGAEMTRAIGL